jgi:hypothetical protein
LRYLICVASGDEARFIEARMEVDRAMGESLAAVLLIFGYAASAKLHRLVVLPLLEELTGEQRSRLPGAMAKAMAVAKDIGFTTKFQLPISYFDETEVQFPHNAAKLEVEEIRSLGELGISTQHFPLAWAASAAGLERGGASEAYFLLLRARALPEGFGERHKALTAAAAELGRFHRDMEVVDRAVEAGRNPFDDNPLKLTVEQAREVLRKEKASPAFPSRRSPGPDYSDLLDDEPCMCPACRRERAGLSPDGEDDRYIDEAEMDRSFFEAAPKDIPREILPALLEVAKEAYATGQDPTDVLARILGDLGGKKKKGKRR